MSLEENSTESARLADLQFALEAEQARSRTYRRRLEALDSGGSREMSQLKAHLAGVTGSGSYRLAREISKGVSRGRRGLSRATEVVKQRNRRGEPAAESDSPAARVASGKMSVLVPVYNQVEGLLTTIRSVEAQSYRNWEIILWDDGSTNPETQVVIRGLDNPAIKKFAGPNQGVVGARNAAFAKSQGSYVCCLDPDDWVDPTYFEQAIARMESEDDLAITYPWVQSFGDRDDIWETADLDPKHISEGNTVPICAVMRREVLEETGGFSPSMSEGYEDWELWAHAASLGFRGRAMSDPLFHYYFNNATGRDSGARQLHDSLRQRILDRHPKIARPDAKIAVRRFPAKMNRRLKTDGSRFESTRARPIVAVVPWLVRVGGAEQMLRDLVSHWVEEGRTVVVVATHVPPQHAEEGVTMMRELTPYVYCLPDFLPDDESFREFMSCLIARVDDPFLINLGSPWLYQNLRVLRASNSACDVVDVLFNHVGHVTDNQDFNSEIDITVAASNRLRNFLRSLPTNSARVERIYVGIEPPLRPEKAVSDGLASWRREDKPLVVWLGRLSEEKRPDWFVHAAGAHAGRADFVMTGDGPMLPDVISAAEHLPHFRYLGVVDDPLEIVARADLLVLTSSVEGIPLAAMEATALGIPVFCTAVGGLPEFLEATQSGEAVVAADKFTFAEALGDLLKDTDRLEKQRMSLTDGLPQAFRRSAMCEEWSKLLGQALSDV